MILSLFAADTLQSCTENGSFFGLKPWYAYLYKNCDADGNIISFNIFPSNGQTSDIPYVLLAIVDDLLQIAALVAFGYILYGAFQYVTSQGSPDGAAKAKSTILNALIGLVIAVTAIGLVTFIGKNL